MHPSTGSDSATIIVSQFEVINDVILTPCVRWVAILVEWIISQFNVFTTGSCNNLLIIWHQAITEKNADFYKILFNR